MGVLINMGALIIFMGVNIRTHCFNKNFNMGKKYICKKYMLKIWVKKYGYKIRVNIWIKIWIQIQIIIWVTIRVNGWAWVKPCFLQAWVKPYPHAYNYYLGWV